VGDDRPVMAGAARKRLNEAQRAARARVKQLRLALRDARASRKKALSDIRAECAALARTRRARIRAVRQRYSAAAKSEIAAIKADERASCQLGVAVARSKAASIRAVQRALAAARKHLPARAPRPRKVLRTITVVDVDGHKRTAEVHPGETFFCPFCHSPQHTRPPFAAGLHSCANPGCPASEYATAERERERERAAKRTAELERLRAAGDRAMAESRARTYAERDKAARRKALKFASKSRHKLGADERRRHGGKIATVFWAMPSRSSETWFDVTGYGATQAERRADAKRKAYEKLGIA
jgi:hypothetical protein